MRVLPNLEIHVTHSCNLTCESCSHYSNQGHKGLISLEEAERWMAPWAERLSPRVFSLVGGEPTIHHQLSEFVLLARRRWPRAMVRLVTNGFFLHRHPELPHALKAAGNAALFLSIHHTSPEYQEKLRPIIALLKDWTRRFGIQVRAYESVTYWRRAYKGAGSTMEPFADGRPRQSWERCLARFYPQVFEERIWKCSPLAYLGMQDAKYHLSEKWQPYLAYRPLEPSCTDAELNAFFDRQEESYCSMCSADGEEFMLPSPLPQPRRTAQDRAVPAKTPLPLVVGWNSP